MKTMCCGLAWLSVSWKLPVLEAWRLVHSRGGLVGGRQIFCSSPSWGQTGEFVPFRIG